MSAPPPSRTSRLRSGLMSGGLSGGLAWALGAVATVILLVHAAHYGATWTDDAYITFRYARNFAAGEGMAFNPGERLEGLTNLGWALLLAPFAGWDLLAVARVCGVASGALTVGVFTAWARREALGIVATGVGLGALVLCAWLPLWMMQGLETPAVALLLTLGWTRYRAEVTTGRGPPVSGLALGLAPWLRPDAALLPMLVGAWHLVRPGPKGGRRVGVSVAIVCALGAALVALKLAWFGSILPNPFHLKVDQFPPERGTAYLQHFFTTPSVLLPGLLLAALAQAGVWAWRRDDRALPGLVFGAYLVAAWLENGDFMPNYRLLVPAWPAACGALALTTEALLRRLGSRRRLAGGAMTIAAVTVALVPQANTFYLDDLNLSAAQPHPAMFPAGKTVPLLAPWKSTRWGTRPAPMVPFPTAWALVHAGAEEVVAYTELGLIAYVHEGPVLDLLGLTDRVMAGVDGESWLDQRAYVAERVSWMVLDTQSGAWPRWAPVLAAEGWPVVAGCGPSWVFANPAKTAHPPDAAEVERRLALALDRAPGHDGLQDAIARELRAAGISTEVVKRYVAAAEARGASVTGLRCELGLTPGCAPREGACAGGNARLVVAEHADPATWPAVPAEFGGLAGGAATGGAAVGGGGAPGSGGGGATNGPDEACLAARTRASDAWTAARQAWVGQRGAGTDDARRLARLAIGAVREGGATARSAVDEAARAAGTAEGSPAAVAASTTAASLSREAAAACGE